MGVITKSKFRSSKKKHRYSTNKKSILKVKIKNRYLKYRKPIKRIDESELVKSFSRMDLRRDYSVYERSLYDMTSLKKLTMAKNRFDCVIQSMYCVGLLDYDRANALAKKIDQEGHRGILIQTVIDFLTEQLRGNVETFQFSFNFFSVLYGQNVFNNGESALLCYTRTDGTAHMVVLVKYLGQLYIYDKQAERVYRIDREFLQYEPNITMYYLFKITL